MSAPLCLYYKVIQLISYFFKKLPNFQNELQQMLVTLGFNVKTFCAQKFCKNSFFFLKELRVYVFKGYYKMHLGHRRRDDAILLFDRRLHCLELYW